MRGEGLVARDQRCTSIVTGTTLTRGQCAPDLSRV